MCYYYKSYRKDGLSMIESLKLAYELGKQDV
jgi:hypothetical protein